MFTHWRLNFTDKTKDKVLNIALLGALSLLIVSFSYSPSPKKVGQPGSPVYDNAKLTPVSSYMIRTYQLIKPLGVGETTETDNSNAVSMVQLIEPTLSPTRSIQPQKSKTTTPPLLNPSHNNVVAPIIQNAPVTSAVAPVVDTLNTVLDQTPLAPVTGAIGDAL